MRPSQYPLPFSTSQHYAAEDYVVSGVNREAHGAVMRWPDWPDYGLIIYGPPASGKTHLAQLFAAAAGAATLDPARIGQGDSSHQVGEARAVILDNAERAASEEGLFHLLNFCKSEQRSLLLTFADLRAREGFALADLRSRLAALPSAGLGAPDDMLLRAVIAKQFADRQLRVDLGVIDYMVARMERSFAAALALVQALDRRAMQTGRPVTAALVRDLMKE